jgi:hypothetical protein
LLLGEGCEVIIGFAAATDGDEGGKEDFNERIIDFPGSGIVIFVTAAEKVLVMALVLRCPLSFLRVLTSDFLTLSITLP